MTEKLAQKSLNLARLAVDVASDGFASDIVLLDIHEVSDFADYFVIMTAESRRQLRNLAEVIETGLEGSGGVRHHLEGSPDSGWVLLDFGDLIVHVFGVEERDFYHIEDAWVEATEVVRLQ